MKEAFSTQQQSQPESEHSFVLTEEIIYDLIAQAPSISSLDESKAPFRNFSDNTETLWQHVPLQEVNDYLDKKVFFNTHKIEHEDVVDYSELFVSKNEKGISIPIDLVVYAAGFSSWKGRPEGANKSWSSKYGSGENKSSDVIKHYAAMPSELPSVFMMTMYLQPDGKIFFDNAGGDSHRIASAVLRGNKVVTTKRLTLCRLSKNYL